MDLLGLGLWRGLLLRRWSLFVRVCRVRQKLRWLLGFRGYHLHRVFQRLQGYQVCPMHQWHRLSQALLVFHLLLLRPVGLANLWSLLDQLLLVVRL